MTTYTLTCVICHSTFTAGTSATCPNGHTAKQRNQFVQEGVWS